jgi:hypothetical protein
MDGNDNNNTLTGTGGCDEIWSYAGHDVVNGQGGNDEIHLGDDYDWGHGNDGADVIHGGGNGTVNKDELFGQGGFDSLYDTGTSGDADLLCGGPNDDSLNTFDSDNRDQMVGEGGTDSLYDGGDSDGKIQDGACV